MIILAISRHPTPSQMRQFRRRQVHLHRLLGDRIRSDQLPKLFWPHEHLIAYRALARGSVEAGLLVDGLGDEFPVEHHSFLDTSLNEMAIDEFELNGLEKSMILDNVPLGSVVIRLFTERRWRGGGSFDTALAASTLCLKQG